MKIVTFASLLLYVTAASAGEFDAEQRADRVVLTCDGKAVARYVFKDERILRPYFAQVHNRDYGLMVANPFGRQAFTKGEASRVEVAKGSTFTLRGGYFVHSTRIGQAAEITTAYQQFIRSK